MVQLARTILFVTLVSVLVIIVFPVSAQIASVDPEPLGLPSPTGTGPEPLIKFISTVVNWFLGLVGLLAAIVLIWGGIKYITSAGHEEAAEEAKRLIMYAIIGLIVIGLAAALVNFILFAIERGGRAR